MWSSSTVRLPSIMAIKSARGVSFATTVLSRARTSARFCKKGEEGYVVSIGTFLQQFYIYGVEFISTGYRVGMKRKELEPVETTRRAEEETAHDRA